MTLRQIIVTSKLEHWSTDKLTGALRTHVKQKLKKQREMCVKDIDPCWMIDKMAVEQVNESVINASEPRI